MQCCSLQDLLLIRLVPTQTPTSVLCPYSRSCVLLTTEQMHCSGGGPSTLLKGTLMLGNEGEGAKLQCPFVDCWSQWEFQTNIQLKSYSSNLDLMREM